MSCFQAFCLTLRGMFINVTVVSFLSATAYGQTLPSTKPAWDIYPEMTLVKGEVIGIGDEKRVFRITLKVIHVFGGTGVSPGDEFVGYNDPHGHSAGDYIEQLPKVGEVGLWLVSGWKGQAFTGDHYAFLDPRFESVDLRFPSRRGMSPRYTEYEVLADAVESVCGADQKSGISLPWKALYSTTPEVSSWAACALVDADPMGLRKLSGNVGAIKKVPLAGQVGLDAGMTTLEESWSSSQEHKAMIANWKGLLPSEREASFLRVRQQMGTGMEEPSFTIGLLKQMALRDKAPSDVAYHCVLQIRRMSQTNRTGGKAAANAALEEIARDSKDQSVKDAARHELETAPKN